VSASARPEAQAPLADPNGSFEIEIASSGRIIEVARDQSVVDALAAAGIDVPVSCEQGICGTCVTMVIAGEPDHRDMFLSAEDRAANDLFTPCCSRANSRRLVLDL
jgi:vanillate O-demethylase ferredoxin subunit